MAESTVLRVRRRFCDLGMEQALSRSPQPPRPDKRKIDGEQEAQLIALLCTQPPDGQEHWSLRLVTSRLIEWEIVSQVSHETVRQVLKKNDLKPWLKESWCIPPQANADFVYHLEDILEVYKRPYDSHHPQVCLDEGGKQLVAQLRQPLPLRPGQPERVDYEYESIGFCRVFLACEPLGGKRVLSVTQRQTKGDWACFVQQLIDEQYPEAEKIVLVMDNLNTHSPASFSEVFEPSEARRLTEKLEIHYTPKHGSWLNIAEIELSVLARQVLSGRLASMQEVAQRVAAWQQKRNQQKASIDWRFTTADARIKLKHLYPSNVA